MARRRKYRRIKKEDKKMELIERVKENTKNGIQRDAENQRGKTPEEIEAVRQIWLANLGSIPEWEKFINKQFDSLTK
jgi:hypothetical protein